MKTISLLACLSGTLRASKTLDKDNAALQVSDQTLSRPLLTAEEVLESEDEVVKPSTSDPVSFQGGLTLLKIRVMGTELLRIPTSDSAPGKYGGGFKVSECAIDLVDTLRREIQDGQLSFRGKKVLELGCGHGLPGIFACVKGASVAHFQDFNAEVLRNVTIPSVHANLDYARARLSRQSGPMTPSRSSPLTPDVHFYAGDWSDVHTVLSVAEESVLEAAIASENRDGFNSLEGDPPGGSAHPGSPYSSQVSLSHDKIKGTPSGRGRLSSSRACHRSTDSNFEGGYDIILMSETVYSVASLPKLCSLIKKCLRPYYGVVYVAGKKHYLGKEGGMRQFKQVIEEDGLFGGHLVREFVEGSNMREVWKFFYRQYSL